MVKTALKMAVVMAGSEAGAMVLESTQSWAMLVATLPAFWMLGYVAGGLIEWGCSHVGVADRNRDLGCG